MLYYLVLKLVVYTRLGWSGRGCKFPSFFMAYLAYDVKYMVVSGHPTLAGLCPLHGFRKAAPARGTLASFGFVSLTVWKERQPCNVRTAAG